MRTWMWVAVATLSLQFFAFEASAQVGVVTGRVVDGNSGLVLPGAQVSLEDSRQSALTDQTGRFLLTSVPAGAQSIVVRYIGYAQNSTPVTVSDGAVASVTIELTQEAIEIAGVNVVVLSDGQARALQQQSSSANLTNIVAADQIGRFPDSNIGDAMKRIPGFAVQMDQGEARFGLIRGTAPQLNSIALNGERVPSAEGGIRQVQLDLIPADMVQTIEVNKGVTPDMDGDAMGASVNIVTRQAPPGQRISATVGSGYNALTGREMLLGNFVYGNRFADDRAGLIVSGSAFNHHLGSDNIEAVWTEGDAGGFVEEMDVRRYDVRRLRRSISAALDYRLSEVSTLNFEAIYNHRNDWENRYRLRFVMDEPDASGISEAAIRRQTKGGGPDVDFTRLEDQRVMSFNGGGEHLLGNRLSTSWRMGFSQASEERPDERYVEWQASDVLVQTDFSDLSAPTFTPINPAQVALDQFAFRRIEHLESFTEEQDLTGRLDFTLPLSLGTSAHNELSFGARIRVKDKIVDNSFVRAIRETGDLANLAAGSPVDYTRTPYLAGPYTNGMFTDREVLGNLDLNNPALFRRQDRPEEYAASNYDASEIVLAGYLMWDRELRPGLSLLAGARVEQTSVEYSGFVYDLDEDEVTATPAASESYMNILPSVHLRYEPNEGTVVRAAWSNTLSRPNYYDLVPYRIVSGEDLTLAIGNPDLEAMTSMNYDLTVERYLSGIGIVSAGVFYKDIKKFIFAYTARNAVDPQTGEVFDEITQPLNGGDANLLGLELAYQQQLDFLPGLLSGLGVYGNYTFTTSSISGLGGSGLPGSTGVERDDEGDLPLPGSPRHTANLSLSYDLGRVGLRGSLNHASSYIDPGNDPAGIGESAFYDRYYDDQTTLDLNGTLEITPAVRFFFEANNLTNQPLRYYQGTRDRMMQAEFYDWRVSAGFKYDLR